MKMSAAVKILISLLLILHFSRELQRGNQDNFDAKNQDYPDGWIQAQKPSDDSIHTSLVMLFSMSPQSLVSLLLLGLTVVLSGSIYLWVLRYACVGCCQPVAVGTDSEALSGMV